MSEPEQAPPDAGLTLDDIRAGMGSLGGMVEFELAIARATNRKLEAANAQLRRALAAEINAANRPPAAAPEPTEEGAS